MFVGRRAGGLRDGRLFSGLVLLFGDGCDHVRRLLFLLRRLGIGNRGRLLRFLGGATTASDRQHQQGRENEPGGQAKAAVYAEQ